MSRSGALWLAKCFCQPHDNASQQYRKNNIIAAAASQVPNDFGGKESSRWRNGICMKSIEIGCRSQAQAWAYNNLSAQGKDIVHSHSCQLYSANSLSAVVPVAVPVLVQIVSQLANAFYAFSSFAYSFSFPFSFFGFYLLLKYLGFGRACLLLGFIHSMYRRSLYNGTDKHFLVKKQCNIN